MEKLQKAMKEILQLIDSGNKSKAIDKVLAFKGDGQAARFELIRALISYAQKNNKYEVARTTLDAFEKIKAKAPKDTYLYYDVANGYQVLYELTITGDPIKAFECEEILESAIRYFEKALGRNPRVLTNLGNLYDSIWRPVEAIDYYEKAIRIDKDFSMALGNEAYALEFLAPISGYFEAYLISAYRLYKSALSNEDSIMQNGSTDAIEFFRTQNRHPVSITLIKSVCNAIIATIAER